MKISEIYKKYRIPSNLQEHMLRVTAVRRVIIDNWQGGTLRRNAKEKISMFRIRETTKIPY